MKHIILNPGNSPNSRGLFSFIIQYISAHRYYLNESKITIDFDLIEKSAYYDSNITVTKNVWNYFFCTENNLNNISPKENIIWTPLVDYYGYRFDFYNKAERTIVSNIINKKLILKNEILNEINLFYDLKMKGKKILGVHKRGTDINYHHPAVTIDQYFSNIDLIKNDYDLIFLTTDERSVVDEFKKRYENVINYSYDSLSNSSVLPNFRSKTVTGYQTGKDAIVDAYLLSRCDFLIKINSNLSNFSLLINENLNFKEL